MEAALLASRQHHNNVITFNWLTISPHVLSHRNSAFVFPLGVLRLLLQSIGKSITFLNWRLLLYCCFFTRSAQLLTYVGTRERQLRSTVELHVLGFRVYERVALRGTEFSARKRLLHIHTFRGNKPFYRGVYLTIFYGTRRISHPTRSCIHFVLQKGKYDNTSIMFNMKERKEELDQSNHSRLKDRNNINAALRVITLCNEVEDVVVNKKHSLSFLCIILHLPVM